MSASRLRAKYRLEDVGSVNATLELTMPINDWRGLNDQLRASPNFTSFPAWEVRDLIDRLVRQATEQFEAEGDEQ